MWVRMFPFPRPFLGDASPHPPRASHVAPGSGTPSSQRHAAWCFRGSLTLPWGGVTAPLGNLRFPQPDVTFLPPHPQRASSIWRPDVGLGPCESGWGRGMRVTTRLDREGPRPPRDSLTGTWRLGGGGGGDLSKVPGELCPWGRGRRLCPTPVTGSTCPLCPLGACVQGHRASCSVTQGSDRRPTPAVAGIPWVLPAPGLSPDPRALSGAGLREACQGTRDTLTSACRCLLDSPGGT